MGVRCVYSVKLWRIPKYRKRRVFFIVGNKGIVTCVLYGLLALSYDDDTDEDGPKKHAHSTSFPLSTSYNKFTSISIASHNTRIG